MILPWEKPMLTLWEAAMLVVVETNENGRTIAAQAGDYWSWAGHWREENRTVFETFAEAQLMLREWTSTGKLRGLSRNGEVSLAQWARGYLWFRDSRIIGADGVPGAADVLVYADEIRGLCEALNKEHTRKLEKATDDETVEAFKAYVIERPLVLSAKAEEDIIRKRLGKRLDRDFFEKMRQAHTTADLSRGPRRGVRHGPILRK